MRHSPFIVRSFWILLISLSVQTVQAIDFFVSVDFSGAQPAAAAIELLVPPAGTTEVFPGYIIMPVDVVSTNGGPVDTEGLRVDYQFTVTDPDGKIKIPETIVPVRFEPNVDPAKLHGTAVVSAAEFRSVESGDVIRYNFRIQQNGSIPPTALNQVTFIKKLRVPVDKEATVTVPSLNFVTGATTLVFRPGALSGKGTLEIEQDPDVEFAVGPKGLQAAPGTLYKFSLEGASLQGPVDLQLALPAESDGRVLAATTDTSINDLAPYWLEKNPVTGQVYGWRRAGRPQTNTAQRSMKLQTSRLGTYALFATGAGTAADYRPRERIITPNSDGINDTVNFMGVTTDDEVKIFDMQGHPIKTLKGPDPFWDGSQNDGRTAESGVYLYQYTSYGERTSGAVVIAK